MILGIEKLLELVQKQNLVEGLSERELTNPEGAGFDLRIGELYEIMGEALLTIQERKTPDVKLVAKYEEGKSTLVTVRPGEYYLMKTVEKVNTPANLVGLFVPRTTLFRSGVVLFTAADDPGYKGELIFGLANLGPCDFKLEMGARVARVIFFEVKGKTSLYRGQWQHGRVTTPGKEKHK